MFVLWNVKNKDDKLDIIKYCLVQFIDDVFKSSDFLLQQCNDENLSKIIEWAKVIKNILKEFKRYIDNL